MAPRSPDESPEKPLDIDELEEAIAGIEHQMGSGFKNGPLSIYQIVAMLQRLRAMPEAQMATELDVLNIPRRCYNRLCALKHDLKHHTRVDIDEVPEARAKKKEEKTKTLHAQAKRDAAPAIAGGLEMTAQEAMKIVTNDIGNTSKRIRALIDATPESALAAIPAVVRDLETVSAANYAEMEKKHGLRKDGLLQRKRDIEAGGETDAKVRKALAALDSFYTGQYARILKEHGLERSLVIRWAMALKQDPAALDAEIERRKNEEKIEMDEKDILLVRDIPVFPAKKQHKAAELKTSGQGRRAGHNTKKKL